MEVGADDYHGEGCHDESSGCHGESSGCRGDGGGCHGDDGGFHSDSNVVFFFGINSREVDSSGWLGFLHQHTTYITP